MRRHHSFRAVAVSATGVAVLLLAVGCGDVEEPRASGSKASTSGTSGADTSLGEGDWLLGMSSAGGADGETTETVYLRYNPSTGAATARPLPGVQAATAGDASAALLVSGDRMWAIPDTGISKDESKSGQLKVYSLSDDSVKTLDLPALTGQKDVTPVGWAFDPNRPDTLRIVGADNRVWAVGVTSGQATEEAALAKGPWVFTNGFNHNTGVPWVESVDSDATSPPGNGMADTSAVTRAGGTVLPAQSEQLTALPPSPCRLGSGFTDAEGGSWVFCADAPAITAYHLAEGSQEWEKYGKPSAPVAPEAAAFPLVLPPVSE
jgi:hypothetical protein